MNHIFSMTSGSDGTLAMVTRVLAALPIEAIEWISENRDWAESKRYELKDEVDASLLASPAVSQARSSIEVLFADGRAHPELDYAEILRSDLAALHGFLQSVLAVELRHAWTVEQVLIFWRHFAWIADIDNAHAMYLSSDNWPFSVFGRLTRIIADLPLGDDDRDALLSGGVRDIRTAVYDEPILRQLPSVPTRAAFLPLVLAHPALLPTGVMPIFLYKTAAESLSRRPAPFRFEEAVQSALAAAPSESVPDLRQALGLYHDLHALRVAYDTYEYFGFYAFVRHLLIYRTTQLLRPLNSEAALRIEHAASLYEYHAALEALDTIELCRSHQ